MKYISRSFIKNLLFCSDIVKVISSKINLKKVGGRYKAFCPFHSEKNPSFVVNKENNFYYCFGCKTYGNVIDFLMNFNKINFFQSIKELAFINSIKIIYDDVNSRNFFYFKKKKFYYLMNIISNLYTNVLLFDVKFKFVREFLFNRGITIEVIKKFSLGYSSFDLVNKILSVCNKKEINFLVSLGFLVKDISGKIYDRLYNRVIFPIYNIDNNIIAFGGRSLKENFCYKYINSANHIYFYKKYCLYGLNLVLKNKSKINRILIVEGYIDVIILNKYNIDYVVALLGSSLNIEQINMLLNYTNNIIFCYDGDKSGKKSSKESLYKILKLINENRMFYFMFLPSGEDPDSLIRKEGKINFENRINNAKSVFDYIFDLYQKKLNLNLYEDKIKFTNCILQLLNKINSPIVIMFLRQKLIDKVGIYSLNELDNIIYYSVLKNRKNYKFTYLRYLIFLLINNPSLSELINLYDPLFILNQDIFILGLSLFLKIVNLCIYNKNISSYDIINECKILRIKYYLKKIICYDYSILGKNITLIFIDILKKFKFSILEKKINYLLFKEEKYNLSLKEKKELWDLIKLKNFCL